MIISFVLFQIKNHSASWPFQKPVDKDDVPDYYDHIKYPMGRPGSTVIVCISNEIRNFYRTSQLFYRSENYGRTFEKWIL